MHYINGYKSYLVAIGIGIIAGLKAYGVEIPEWVFPVLGALGLGAIGHKINRL